jgi:hypothetical protein
MPEHDSAKLETRSFLWSSVTLLCYNSLSCGFKQNTFSAGGPVMDSLIFVKRLSILALLMIAVIAANQLARAEGEKKLPPLVIATDTPLSELLPAWRFKPATMPVLVFEDVGNVPQVMLSEPISSQQTKDEAIAKIMHSIAQINHLNKKNPDGFIEALLTRRNDLRGLPFRMGKGCRTNPEKTINNGRS